MCDENKVTIYSDSVCIPLEVYEDLLRDSDRYLDLREAIYRFAYLSHIGRIAIADEKLEIILRMIDSNRYEKCLHGLQKEKERSEGDGDK